MAEKKYTIVLEDIRGRNSDRDHFIVHSLVNTVRFVIGASLSTAEVQRILKDKNATVKIIEHKS